MHSSDFIQFPHLVIYGLHIAFYILLFLLVSDTSALRNNTVRVMLGLSLYSDFEKQLVM